MKVLIDIRETDLWAELAGYREPSDTSPWHVEQATLDVGDIAFVTDMSGAPAVVMERKTAEDLGASQKDGRYREQRARLFALRGAGTAIGYIVESPPWSPSFSRTWCRGAFTEVHLQQTIARLHLRYTIPVFQSTSVKDTATWIRRIAGQLVTDPNAFKGGLATDAAAAAAAYTEAINVKKADNKTPERIFHAMLMTLPGLGKAAVDAIAAATNSSFTALQALTEEQIADIPTGKRKVGKAVAASVYAGLHS